MAGWGLKIFGMQKVRRMLENLSIEVGTDAVYVVGSSVEYAVYQELGTSRMEANPFLQPAAEDARQRIPVLARQANTGSELVRLVALYVERRAKHYASTGVPPGPDVKSGNLRGSIEAQRIK